MRVAIVTGTRADYGLIRPVARAIHAEGGWELGLLVTAAHLAPEFGMTVAQVEADGLPVAARVPTLDSDDTGLGTARATGRGTIGMAEALDAWRPDLLLVVGDRFEQLAAAQAALFLGIPVAHLYGGDVTEGAFDDAIRHAITKLAHLHFVSNEAARRRVIQLGEAPERVHLVGSPALDEMLSAAPTRRDELARDLGLPLDGRTAVVTFHPATLDAQPAPEQLDAVLGAVADVTPPLTVVITRANADPQGRAVNARIDRWLAEHPDWRAFDALGPTRYQGLLRHAAVVVGNSSSGLYEAPSFGVPTVNVGDRQLGRLRASSVIDVPVDRARIRAAIDEALAGEWHDAVNPYGDGHATPRIMAALRAIDDPGLLLRKRFHDLPVADR
jgi:UDP-N-acetylglucosamine 2-epimerase (non-hydrolysing)/GDP/UDP-N,N'-diacetylbacillosamine 2-epimerase (hydrolysing)